VNPADQPTQPRVALNLDPPRIFYSRQPAILVMFLGEPQFRPVVTNRTDLMFALNSNWDFFYDTVGQRYYLLNQDTWLTASDVKGPWLAAPDLPASFFSLPTNENWLNVRQNIPGKSAKQVPVVFVSTQPAEMIITQGDPSFTPIPGTRLMRVANTDSMLFLNSGDSNFYLLVAGRWFCAAGLDGPWTSASTNLPADFAQIPDNDPSAFVKASVPGTRAAQDAVMLASVPTTIVVALTNPPVEVTYSGDPQFASVENTAVQYAVNSPYSVLLVSGTYYCCDQGVWFNSGSATGPWTYCTSVPPVIYTIPPSCPVYNVTYVGVQSYTPTTVVYCQSSGYSGQYVATTGVLMFGAGVAWVNNPVYYSYYCYPTPVYYSYGCGAVYNYAYGGYYSAARVAYGPYGGVGYATSYNPATGTYARGAYAYGPYGSAGVKQAYNPYTGGYVRAAQVNTAYGSAGRVAGYNPKTGTYAAGGYRSTAYGTSAAVKTGQGTGAAAWNTQNSQGAVARTQSGDVYAAKDGTVYKKDSNGNWSQNTGSGWSSATRPVSSGGNAAASPRAQANSYYPQQRATGTPYQAPAANNWSQNQQNLEAQAQARDYGNQLNQRAQSWGGGGGEARQLGGGGGRRR
jgi:hypothetical protein